MNVQLLNLQDLWGNECISISYFTVFHIYMVHEETNEFPCLTFTWYMRQRMNINVLHYMVHEETNESPCLTSTCFTINRMNFNRLHLYGS